MMNKPIAVCVSDLHFDLNTKEIAARCLKAALTKAEDLDIPLVIAGDTNDTKAILRGECVKLIINTLEDSQVLVYALIGNHDLINEKGETHSLEFLKPYAQIVQSPVYIASLGAWLVPYRNSTEKFREALAMIKTYGAHNGTFNRIIMHQGVMGAHLGEYAVDKTSVTPEELADFKVLSGHYHRNQTIGTVEYIGNPYTHSFAEANDGPKGFKVLYDDFTTKLHPLNERKHVIAEVDIETIFTPVDVNPTDLLWIKVKGPSVELEKLSKKEIGKVWLGHQNFKLDKIPTDVESQAIKLDEFTDSELLDKLVNDSSETPKQKKYLLNMWREIMNDSR